MTEWLSNKTVVITGGSSGMGHATALKLLAVGATVHIIDIQPLASGHQPYPQSGKLYTHIPVDITSRDQVRRAFQEIDKVSPDIYGVVNAAGAAPEDDQGRLIESDAVFHKTFSINALGCYHVTTEFLTRVRDRNDPAAPDAAVKETKYNIVTLGSSAALVGFPQCCTYTGAKHAVLGFTRTWSLDWAPYGVRSNMVAPGATNTPLARVQMPDNNEQSKDDVYGQQDRGAIMDMARLKVPLKRWGEADELADGIIFLLSEKSSYITGQVLPVNGGWPP
ncbi:uncharacterized protein E0L32_007901 [Thyridium curvatum]|uniref:Uncharacterized protein n=1 Tax=Thyridium curvatum TaxID=1093900 RepID=A0A507ANJ1_9PEZI|nr:uncharacterized protein E0L32_007901 [Thyridium curvatum]TPX11482.1 hypothetical protein E0L32_007901 [Thyridium curvatum]